MTKEPSVVILGAGIMGSCAALMLARKGFRVTLVDAASQPFHGASRWNEGKIHLGYLYAADQGLQTTKHLLQGSLSFRPIVEQLLESSIQPAISQCSDIFLCHRDSIVDSQSQWAYLQAVDQLVCEHKDAANYLVDSRFCQSRKMSASEVAGLTDHQDIVAGFYVPEHSVSTNRVADMFVAALKADSRINLLMNTRVTSVRPVFSDGHESWKFSSPTGEHGNFDFMVNALWEGKLAIDQNAGVKLPVEWSHRYRRALFINTSKLLDIPSAIITTGAFGDLKNYDGREFYLSWYPAGLGAYGIGVNPPSVPELDREESNRLVCEIFDSMADYLPEVRNIQDAVESCRLDGGWVFAAGKGELSSPGSTLHRRDEFGISQLGHYFSIDTGKYGSAPWLAKQLADQISG